MHALIFSHPLLAAFAAFWLFSAFVSGMPEPSPVSSIAYQWLFHSLNVLVANLGDLIRTRYPRMPLPAEEMPANPTSGRLLQMPPASGPKPPDAA